MDQARPNFCSAFIPADVFYSLSPCLAAGTFKQMEWRVHNLRYRKGEMDGIWLESSLSDLDEDAREYSCEEPALVDRGP